MADLSRTKNLRGETQAVFSNTQLLTLWVTASTWGHATVSTLTTVQGSEHTAQIPSKSNVS